MRYLTDEDYEMAKKKGISETCLYQRFHVLGQTVEQALSDPPKLTARGNLWLEYKERAEALGLNEFAFRKRMTKTDSPEKALSYGKGQRQSSRITEKHYRKAEKRGIHRQAVQRRVYSDKWSVTRAITQPLDHSRSRKKSESM